MIQKDIELPLVE